MLLELSLGQPRPENKNWVQPQHQPAAQDNLASSQAGYDALEQGNYFNKNTGTASQFATSEDLAGLHQLPGSTGSTTDIKHYFANINNHSATYHNSSSIWPKL